MEPYGVHIRVKDWCQKPQTWWGVRIVNWKLHFCLHGGSETQTEVLDFRTFSPPSHLEIASLIGSVRGSENGDVPDIHVRVVGYGDGEPFHGVSVQRLQLHGQSPDGRGVGRRHVLLGQLARILGAALSRGMSNIRCGRTGFSSA